MPGTPEFIAGIRSSLGFDPATGRDAQLFRSLFPEWDAGAVLDRIEARTLAEKRELASRFREQAGPLKLEVHEAAGFEDAGRIVMGIISKTSPEFEEAPHVIQHDHPDCAALALAKQSGDEMLLYTTSVDNRDVRAQTISSYVGITAPSWGVADTATVLQVTEPGQPRSTSLVPSIHIAILRLENILADLVEIYAILHKDPPASSYVFISGPSKTADIEAQLVHGAHGPKDMHVVIVDSLT
jgi:L-lactate dehydrogenase complex protein LldG